MTAKVFVVYDPSSGVLLERHVGEPPDEGAYLEGDYSFDEHLVINGKVTKAPHWSVNVEPNKITGIPARTKGRLVSRPDDVFVVNDGVLEFDLVKGQMVFVVLQPPGCAPKEFEVHP